MSILVYDIETVPLAASLAAPYPAEERQPPSNYKSDEAIAKWRAGDEAKWREGLGKECSLSPRLGRVLAIGTFALGDTADPVANVAMVEESEAALLTGFWHEVGRAGTRQIIAGFNSISFDLPFLVTRSLILGVTPSIVVPDYLRHYNYAPHFDVRMALTFWDSYTKGTLAEWCRAFGIEAPEGKGSEMYERYLAGDRDAVALHCRTDVRATAELVAVVGPTFGVAP